MFILSQSLHTVKACSVIVLAHSTLVSIVTGPEDGLRVIHLSENIHKVRTVILPSNISVERLLWIPSEKYVQQ